MVQLSNFFVRFVWINRNSIGSQMPNSLCNSQFSSCFFSRGVGNGMKCRICMWQTFFLRWLLCPSHTCRWVQFVLKTWAQGCVQCCNSCGSRQNLYTCKLIFHLHSRYMSCEKEYQAQLFRWNQRKLPMEVDVWGHCTGYVTFKTLSIFC